MSPEKSLAEILAQHMRANEPIPVAITLVILRQVCDALEYAHNLRDPEGRPLGIVHRDVSPACIFVGEGGIARLVASSAPHGTYAYMAPEFIATGMLDARADLFGLGVIAHEMLANQPLFATGDDRATLDRVMGLPIPPPSSLNPYVAPDIDGVVLMALARDPAYRWQHAAMMREGLQAVAQRLGLEGAPPQSPICADLLSDRLANAPVAAPAPMPPPQAPPPLQAPDRPTDAVAVPDIPSAVPGEEVWADDTGLETRIQPVDPRLMELQDAPPAPKVEPAPARTPAQVRAQTPLPTAMPPPGRDQTPAPVRTGTPAHGRAQTPAPVRAQTPPQGRPQTASPARVQTPPQGRPQVVAPVPVPEGELELAPAGMSAMEQELALVQQQFAKPRPSQPRVQPQPQAQPYGQPPGPAQPYGQPQPQPYAQPSYDQPPQPYDLSQPYTPPQDPGPDAAAAPAARRPVFEPELGPEPTQIGAMPLISFGNTPLASLVGENSQRRSSAPSLPPPIATFVPEVPEAPAPGRKKRLVIIGVVVAVLAIALVVIVLATS